MNRVIYIPAMSLSRMCPQQRMVRARQQRAAGSGGCHGEVDYQRGRGPENVVSIS